MNHSTDSQSSDAPRHPRHDMTLSKLRHDIRNQLNAIKLSCALLHRQSKEPAVQESAAEVDHAADAINDLITRYLSDSDAPGLLVNQAPVRPSETKPAR